MSRIVRCSTQQCRSEAYTRDILRQIGKALNGVQNRISLAGHTDAAQFAGGEKGFSNWELSANRANASRDGSSWSGGMDDSKVLRVVGLASTVLFDKNDPLNSVNRRISIVVLNSKTEQAILQEEGPDGRGWWGRGASEALETAPDNRAKGYRRLLASARTALGVNG